MANQLSIHQANQFYGQSQLPNGNAALINYIYSRFVNNIQQWQQGGPNIPAGAMAFHGDRRRHTDM
jgi:hypothetical protein